MAARGKLDKGIDATHPLLAAIQRELDEDVDLAALADQFGYSPFHFHRVFKSAVGETPKTHVARLRLEKALLLVVATNATILDIALAVGFRNHETFTRAFRKHFGANPGKLRRDAREIDRQAPKPVVDEPCTFSPVRYLDLPAKHLLARRKMGPYTEPFVPPYFDGDLYWSSLVDRAERSGLGHARLPYAFFPDMPGITPEAQMRTDFCIEIERQVAGDGDCFYAPFEGGRFGMVEHRGSYATLPTAYRVLVNAILADADRYVLTGGAPFQILREVHIGGEPMDNLTEVYFPVTPTGSIDWH